MENLKIKDPTRSREEWMEIAGLPEDLRQNVMAADVLIVPSMIQDHPKAFKERMAGNRYLAATGKFAIPHNR